MNARGKQTIYLSSCHSEYNERLWRKDSQKSKHIWDCLILCMVVRFSSLSAFSVRINNNKYAYAFQSVNININFPVFVCVNVD